MGVEQLIESGLLQPFCGGVLESAAHPAVAVNPKSLDVKVANGVSARLVLLYTTSSQSVVNIDIDRDASLDIVAIYAADSYVSLSVNQSEGSVCKTMSALVSSSNVTYNYALNGVGAESVFNAVFVVEGREHSTLNLNTRHLTSDCKSCSLVKGVSAGNSTGEFHGLVYVAPDAQRTDAQQQSRNIELDNSRIISLPQLEIYADDVKCSHGSTVGYSDAEALFYMRQRGLSQAAARRLQIEGFINDVVSRCDMEGICSVLHDAVTAKLERL